MNYLIIFSSLNYIRKTSASATNVTELQVNNVGRTYVTVKGCNVKCQAFTP